MATLTLERVSKVYANGFRGVDEVSFEVASGGFCVLLGPSGCGKSSTLRMVAGLESVSAGVIRIDGSPVNAVAPKDRDIAMVFQSYALYPHLSVAENIAFPLRMRGVGKHDIRARVADVASMLELTEILSRRPAQLSGGQRQRVALARAIVRRPKVFLFDEPLSNLDARMRHHTRSELKALHARLRVTSLYVTHDQEEAMCLADTVVVMAGGRVRQVAPPMQVFEAPADRFVAGFVGSPAMNFMDATLEERGAGRFAVRLGGVGGAGHVLGGYLRAEGASPDVRAGARVVVGVRPSSVCPVADGARGVPGEVEMVELLGETMDVTVRTPVGRLVARIPARRGIEAGTRLAWRADPGAVHVFEPGADGRRIGGMAEDARADDAGAERPIGAPAGAAFAGTAWDGRDDRGPGLSGTGSTP
ncbi:MAG: ATP-binding cassette domain-containing protein [Planctomycetota bacterium]|nr:ATP-binding cassette domain-containing protein [Planctomycetota bacterium]